MLKEITALKIAKALLDKEFVFYYQPIVSLITGKICGAEALVRWKTKDGELISPSNFIPLAEEGELITELTLEAISTVFRDLPQIDKVDNSIWVSFNTSAKDFTDNRVANCISQELTNFNFSPARIHLEITETAFLPLNPQTKQSIFNIHDMGLKIALNDFTAGYSTFDYLSRLPFSTLKIALPLTQRTATSRMDWKLFRHLVSLGHQLHYDVIAEGVENDELHTLILSTGCTSVQGYYYSRPIPLNDFIALVKKSQTWVDFPYGLMYLAQVDHIDFRRDVIREALTIYGNSDEKLRQQAKSRLPNHGDSEEQFYKWFLKTKKDNHEILLDYVEHEKNFHRFHASCNELLQLAEQQVAYDVFENKLREIIETSTTLTHSLIRMSSEWLIKSSRRKSNFEN
jgi:EAL domain-containing protein (putative c-di-GMP-specific phosphodiesterase class I)